MESGCAMPAFGLALVALALNEMVKAGEITEEEAAVELKRIKEK